MQLPSPENVQMESTADAIDSSTVNNIIIAKIQQQKELCHDKAIALQKLQPQFSIAVSSVCTTPQLIE